MARKINQVYKHDLIKKEVRMKSDIQDIRTWARMCFSIFFLSILTSLVSAQTPYQIEPFVTPFGTFNFQRPTFPQKQVSIVEFGATEGGTVKVTAAINKAISQLAELGGGQVVVPKGKWLTGPIVLKSNINLHLAEGAELLFSQDFSDYLPAVLTNWEGSEVYSYSPFIYAFQQENIAITGKGVLNGQGKPWWENRKQPGFGNKKLIEMNHLEVPVKDRRFDSPDNFLPPSFFGPLYCKNILIEGVTFRYGAFWTVNPSFCENIIVRDTYILTNGDYGDTPNGDGINPNSCTNVLIEYNILDTGDDCITIKSGRDNDGRRIGIPCKNILIRYNKGLQGHGGIVIGSEMSGGVENVYAHDCRFNGTDRIIRIKTDRGRGGYVRNCWFKDIFADTIEQQAIRINMLYSGNERLPALEVNSTTPVIENIHYENIYCDFAKQNVIQILGIPEMPVNNITFKNIQLKGQKGIEIIDARNISLTNIAVNNTKGPAVSIAFSDSIQIEKFTIEGIHPELIPISVFDTRHFSLKNLVYKGKDDGKWIQITGNSDDIFIDQSIPENRISKN
jgi:polygalacturonase